MTSTSARARTRPRRTRTTRVNAQPTLVVSTLSPIYVDLRSGAMCLVCPDCNTWCPITGHQGTTPKLVPHHTEPVGSLKGRRCNAGSNRLVNIDLTVAEWQQRLGEGIAETSARRDTRVLRKPKTPPAPPVNKVNAPAVPTLTKAREDYINHRDRCGTCTGRVVDEDGQRLDCPDRRRLALLYAQLLRQEPKRRQDRARREVERADFERRWPAMRARQRAAQWPTVLPLVRRADAQRIPVGAVSTYKGPDLPLEPISITA